MVDFQGNVPRYILRCFLGVAALSFSSDAIAQTAFYLTDSCVYYSQQRRMPRNAVSNRTSLKLTGPLGKLRAVIWQPDDKLRSDQVQEYKIDTSKPPLVQKSRSTITTQYSAILTGSEIMGTFTISTIQDSTLTGHRGFSKRFNVVITHNASGNEWQLYDLWTP